MFEETRVPLTVKFLHSTVPDVGTVAVQPLRTKQLVVLDGASNAVVAPVQVPGETQTTQCEGVVHVAVVELVP